MRMIVLRCQKAIVTDDIIFGEAVKDSEWLLFLKSTAGRPSRANLCIRNSGARQVVE